MHMIKLGGKLGGITPAPWVLPVPDAKDDTVLSGKCPQSNPPTQCRWMRQSTPIT